MQSEARMAQYVAALERYRSGRLSYVEAAELLGISERHFRRLNDLARAEGLIDRQRERYWDFTVGLAAIAPRGAP
jgi:hypothetical protein